MDDSTTLGRREFTLQSALAVLGGVAITITGCSSDSFSPTSPSPTPAPMGSPSNVTGSVVANHGHEAVITGAQLMAADAISLNIQGAATHPHTVELTTAEVTQIDNGGRVSKDSSTDDGHRHVVTFN